ncbi:uncharacterized protein LOC128119224 [Peromyscus californicus insignis]|uniref:uncharacterized protein LOC128119224 n=1 Tax=Peromyscus californicus insignis TaxID=564181 RepID=UPI0022A79ED1|nr:uncharacterized protein LOC128119224 [Peromyscus californicus insignis]
MRAGHPPPPPQVVFAPLLLLWRADSAARGGLVGDVRSGDPLSSSQSSLSRGGPSRVMPRGHQTCKSHRGAGGVQGPLSAAARIDPARPWVKYHFQSRPGTGSWRDARVAGDGCPRPRWGAAEHGDLGLSIRGAPHGLWVTGSRRRRASKATGIDRTPPLRGWCSLGAPGRSFKLWGRSRSERPVGDADPFSGPSRAWPCLLAAAGDRKSLGEEVGCSGQGLLTTFCLGMQKLGSAPPGSFRALEQGRQPRFPVGKARQKAFPEQTCSPTQGLASSAWLP